MIMYEKKSSELIEYTCFFDGGSRGNPGPGAYGVVIINNETNKKLYLTGYLGDNVTNIDAEYCGLITCLKWLVNNNAKSATIKGDSELVIRQMNYIYKARTDKTKKYFNLAKQLETQLHNKIKYIHVLRNKNSEADTLVNKTLDKYCYANSTRTSKNT